MKQMDDIEDCWSRAFGMASYPLLPLDWLYRLCICNVRSLIVLVGSVSLSLEIVLQICDINKVRLRVLRAHRNC